MELFFKDFILAKQESFWVKRYCFEHTAPELMTEKLKTFFFFASVKQYVIKVQFHKQNKTTINCGNLIYVPSQMPPAPYVLGW